MNRPATLLSVVASSHSTRTGRHGKIAVERVKELRPDVVILDLPIMNGLEAARQVSRLGSAYGHADVYAVRLRAAS